MAGIFEENCLKDVLLRINEYECDTESKFVTFMVEKAFGDMEFKPSATMRYYYEHGVSLDLMRGIRINFDGVPFTFVGRKILTCHKGPDQKKRQKEKYKREKDVQMKSDHPSTAARRNIAQPTKKRDCEAEIYIQQIVKFPSFKIENNTKKRRDQNNSKIRASIQSGEKVDQEILFLIKLPEKDCHTGHPVGGEVGGMMEPVDKRIVTRIVELTKSGVRRAGAMRRLIAEYVSNELFRGEEPPARSRGRFYPTKRDINNIMYKARKGYSRVDQENLGSLVDFWKEKSSDDKLYFRPRTINPGSEEEDHDFLFIYQASWQQRLLLMYGQEIVLLDATYKTCEYAMPLFFLCVRTNVAYAVIGVFISQRETTASIQEALEIFKSWNPNWQPKNFMTDFCVEEISALENVFEGTKVFLCDFHREKAWNEWLRKESHGVASQKDAILAMLRRIAYASSYKDFEESIEALKASVPWKQSTPLQNWLSNKWLPAAKRWVRCFKAETLDIAVHTNNGVERQNETLKYSYLDGYRRCSISELLTVIINDFLPDTYRRYVELNTKSMEVYRSYSEDLPCYLKNRPKEVVKFIYKNLSDNNVPVQNVQLLDDQQGIFSVATSSNKSHRVDYAKTIPQMPSCTCYSWRQHKLPCEHFCAIFKNFPNWTWENLNDEYKNNPLFQLDPYLLPNQDDNEECANSDDHNENVEDHTNISAQDPSLLLDLPERKSKRKRAIDRCIGIVKMIKDDIYNIKDTQYLEELLPDLKALSQQIQSQVPLKDGIPTLITPKKRKSASYTDNMAPLPKIGCTGRQKNLFSNRVGKYAEEMKRSYKVNLPIDIKSENSTAVDIPRGDHKSFQVVDLTTCPEVEMDFLDTCSVDTQHWLKIDKITLTNKSRETIASKRGWLDDDIINACLSLLADTYSHLDGFENTLQLASTHGSVDRPATTRAVQIHHLGNHWVTSFGSPTEGVTVYDSLTPRMSHSLRSQIVKLYRIFARGSDGLISVRMITPQQQPDGSSCGLFAVANAVALCKDIDPLTIKFDSTQMREHMIKCLEASQIIMFPHKIVASKIPLNDRCETVSKYCKCYTHKFNKKMIECSDCKQWYHFECVKLTCSDVAMLCTDEDFHCPSCL